MKIAYFIMAHHKSEQLLNLLQTIYDESNIYLVHVDSKASSDMHDLLNDLVSSNDNIHSLPSRSVTWGSWSLVQLEIDAIKHLLSVDQTWQYYINLSGQDMPLVSQAKVKQFLLASAERNYLAVSNALESDAMEAFNHYWVEDCGALKNLGPRPTFHDYFVEGIEPYKGTQWKVINRQFAEFAVMSRLAFDMQDYFRYMFIPDELYFQTLIMNSPFKDSVVNNHLRFLRMEQKEGEMFRRPRVLTTEFLMDMFSTDAIFARKFDPNTDAEVIAMIKNTLG